ncbi:MAG TPA: single-stranded DNA-binding protein [bacterium]|nr:single-stranded DNA-binding protein [bacterium]
MRKDLNTITLSGRLGAAVNLHQKNGTEGPVKSASFSLACDRVEKGEKKTDWFRVVLLGEQQVAACDKFLTKGSAVIVEGSLRVRSWETREGDTRKDVEIVASTVHFLDKRKEQKAA